LPILFSYQLTQSGPHGDSDYPFHLLDDLVKHFFLIAKDEVLTKCSHGSKIVIFVIVGTVFLQRVIGEMNVIIVN
jgi:hypothetical protein